MARVTHVKKAQQRYETKPVLDENGEPVRIPLTRKDGTPKMTRAKGNRPARPVFITKTEPDKTKPKPLLRCDFPGCQIDGGFIAIGTPYKWIKPKSGPYGGHQRNRHAAHPSWNVWDYSSSLSAQVARIEHDATSAAIETTDDAQSVLEEAANAIRELAEQKRESASNIEDGFGHATSQSEELESQADELEGWADEVEGTEIPDQADYAEDTDCESCNGTGEETDECGTCDGSGEVNDETCTNCDGIGEEVLGDCSECGGLGEVEADPENLTVDQLAEWQEAVQEAISEALGNCPV